MSKDWPMSYERVIRRAFGGVDRFGDPAKLANTDAFSSTNIDSVKSGLGYSGSMIQQHAWSKNDTSAVQKIDNILPQIWSASTLTDFEPIIDELHKILDSLGL